MRQFIIVRDTAATLGLNDMPSRGRLDILAQYITAALLTSFDIRCDTRVRLLLLGVPDPPKVVRFKGQKLTRLYPNERSAGTVIKKALQVKGSKREKCSTPSVYLQRADLEQILCYNDSYALFCLHKCGKDVGGVDLQASDVTFVLTPISVFPKIKRDCSAKHREYELGQLSSISISA